MTRKLIYLISAVYFVALAALAILIHRASPGPISQEILGVGIGNHRSEAEIVYLSGRRLHCTRVKVSQPFASKCTVEVAGQTLEIHARRNAPTDPNQLGGTCEAIYDGKQWPCEIGSRHVDVPWFAYIAEPLGMSESQLDTLRREYFFENLPETTFFVGMLIVPVATMLVAIAVTVVWLWSKGNRVSVALIAAVLGLATLVGTFILSVFLTSGFWD